EVADALVLRGIRVGAREEDHVLRDVRAGGPDLLAVDDVVVAVLRRARLQRGEVGARAWLAEALAPDRVALDDRRQVFPLLLLRAVEDDRRAGPARADAVVAAARRARLRHLLVEDELLHDGHARTAVLLRPRRGDPAAGGELLRPVGVEPAVLVRAEADVVPAAAPEHGAEAAARDAGRALGADELAHLGAEGGFFGRVVEIHRPSRAGSAIGGVIVRTVDVNVNCIRALRRRRGRAAADPR